VKGTYYSQERIGQCARGRLLFGRPTNGYLGLEGVGASVQERKTGTEIHDLNGCGPAEKKVEARRGKFDGFSGGKNHFWGE